MSKKLFLIRHADTKNKAATDFDRVLTKEGVAEAISLGEQLNDAQIKFDTIISSSAARAQATAKIIAAAQGIPETQILLEMNLYHAMPEEIDLVLSNLAEATGNIVALIGHNSGISDFANKKIQYRTPSSMRTATIVGMEIPIERWEDNHPGIIASSL